MLDLNDDVQPLSDCHRDATESIRRMKRTGRPVVLTVDGKAELVVQDAASYRKLLDLAERAERLDSLRASVADMEAGRVNPVEDLLADMRRILSEPGTR